MPQKVALGWHTPFVGRYEASEPDGEDPEEWARWRSRPPHGRMFLFAGIGAAAVGVVAVVGALVVSTGGLWATTSGFAAKPCTSASAQAQFQCSIIQDQSSLIPGTVDVLQRVTIPLGQSDQFAITICGERSPRCSPPGTASGRGRPEASKGAAQVLVGGYISAKLASGGMPGQVESESDQVQPVITETDAATWTWEIEPTQAGTFALTLTVTPLRGSSDTPLVAGKSYVTQLTVTESTGQQLAHAAGIGGTITRNLGKVVAALITMASAAAVIWRHARKRKKAAAEPITEMPAHTKTPAPTGPHLGAESVPRHRRPVAARHRRTD